jgi:protein-S-isoprenylcysteine O-methyltransferase Ste14
MPAQPYTREAFGRMRAAAAEVRRRAARPLAAVSVLLGLLQLVALRWLDRHVQPDVERAIAASAFVAYMAVVAWLFLRMQRAVRTATPRCPQCGTTLTDLSERVATATGRCDVCGGQVVE